MPRPRSLIGHRVRERRKEVGWTQAELARRTGLSSAAISQIESGDRNPSGEVAARLAEALRVTADYLLGKKDFDFAELLADPDLRLVFRGLPDLSDGDKRQLIDFYRFLASRQSREQT